jgi:MATE family multidrug resistance protein
VIEGTRPFLFWLVLMPIISCAAFMWDGIYIGATASIPIRNSMIWACVAFYVIYFIFRGSTDSIQVLWYAYFAHLIARALYLTIVARKEVFGKC